MSRKGFTLLELIFVIAIICMLIAAMCPLFVRSRETAKRSSCANNLYQLGEALHLYAQDYDGRLPRKDNDYVGLLRSGYGHKDSIFCPSDREAEKWESAWRYYDKRSRQLLPYSSYVYRGGLTNEDSASTPLMSEIKPWHGDLVNILYLSGYVKSISAEGFKPVVAPPDLSANGRRMPLLEPERYESSPPPEPRHGSSIAPLPPYPPPPPPPSGQGK